MTMRLTPAQQVPSALGRLSMMCCSHLILGDRQRGWGGAGGGPQHPKCLRSPHLAASVVSPPKCCEGTVGASWVSPGGLSIPWVPASPPGRG